MLQWIVRLSLEYRLLVFVLACATLALGGFTLKKARVDILPEFDAPIVEVQTEALGLSAAEVEDLVTINLEEILTAAPYLKSIHSKSVPGLSSVMLTFEPGTDLMRARQMVQERLTMAWALPNVSKPPVMLQPASAARRAMIVGLSSKDVSLIDMSVLARWTMTPKLLSVPGVANVSIWGQRARQLQVQVDPRRLQSKGVTLKQVVESTGDSLWVSPLTFLESSVLGTGGWIDTPNQRLGIQHVQPISKASDLAKISISDSPLTLGDVATVVEGHPPLIGDALVNDGPGVLLVIEKFPNAGTTEVIKGLEGAIAELSQGMPGIAIETSIYKATRYVNSATSGLGYALIIGGALMALALMLSFMAVRPAILALSAIALSIMTALLVLYFRGATLNIMHIVGLAAALAALVDGALIAVEAIVRRRAQDGGRSLAAAVFDAMGEIRHPLIYATLIGMLTIAPVFWLMGSSEAFFGPLAQSYLLALIASLVVTFIAVPGLALILLRRHGNEITTGPARISKLTETYRRLLSRFSASPASAYAIAAIGAWALVGSLALLDWSPIPAFKERDAVISWEAAPGTSHPSMVRMMTRLSAELRAVEGVNSVAGHIGRAVTGDQVTGIESGQLWVGIGDRADYAGTMALIHEVIQGIPGINGKVESYLAGNAQRIMPGTGDPVIVRIEGAEQGTLEEEAKHVAEKLALVPGVDNVRIDSRTMAPEIRIQVDVTAAAKFGLKPGDIRRTTATVFGGLEVGNLFEEQKVFEVVVWGAASARQSISNVEDLLIDGPGGSRVRLGDVAKVNFVPTPRQIDREGVTRSIDIHADVKGRDAALVAGDVKAELSKMAFPFEYHAYLLGDYAGRKAASWNLMLAAAAAAALIFFLLQAAVQNWQLAIALSISLLAAMCGGLLAVLATGGIVSLGSLAGFLTLLGLATRNSLVTVNRARLMGTEMGTSSTGEIAMKAAAERFWPLLTSAFAVALAFAPAALTGDAAGLEIIRPMALVVMGGLVSCVLVSLFVVPTLLYRMPVRPQLHFVGEEHYAHP